MRFLVWILTAAALLAPQSRAQTQDDLFDDRVLHEVRLRINPRDWQSLKDHFRENTYYPAIWEWRGLVANDVGIRSRGQGSRSPVKPNLRVDFNRYDDSGSFLGLTVLQLKANNQDPSFLKERLSMMMFLRMGLPASREVYTRLYVNDQYAGLYAIVEEVNKEFLTRNFAENGGYLYEWNLPDEPYRFEYPGPDVGKYVPLPWEPKTHETNPQPGPLEAMVRTVNQASDAEFPRAATEYLDLKLFATHVAIENYISEFDGILGQLYGMNNFYFYRFKGKNLSQFIVWDKDRAFADADRDIFLGVNGNVLSRRALQIPEVRTAYLEALARCAVLAGDAGGWMEQEAGRQYQLVQAAVREDDFKQYFDGSAEKPSSNDLFESEVAYMKQYAASRTPSVLRQVNLAGYRRTANGPRVGDQGVVNTQTGAPGGLAPGSMATLFGERLTDTTAQAVAGQPPPVSLGGVVLLVNGFPAPLLSVSPTQVDFQIPTQILPGTVPVTIFFNGALGNTVTVDVSAY